ncbi:MAG: iron-sulfur cluster assembly accessory protein [Myxococcota bacterium]
MPIQFTAAATDRGRELVASKGASWLRLGIRSGGCSGLSYFVDFVPTPDETDKQFEFDGLKVCVDRKSYLFLNGTEIDFESSLVKSGFVFTNPAAKRSCSCGESFTL